MGNLRTFAACPDVVLEHYSGFNIRYLRIPLTRNIKFQNMLHWHLVRRARLVADLSFYSSIVEGLYLLSRSLLATSVHEFPFLEFSPYIP